MNRMLATVFLGLLAAPGGAAEGKAYTRNVAIVIYENAEPLDWTGPYEVYNDASRFGGANGQPAFNVYMVSKTAEPLDSQGLKVVPNYSIENAPRPDIVLFPGGPSNKIYDDPVFFAWASKAAKEAEIAQSVCTGAFVLGKAGLLDGLEVTTHFGSIERLQQAYPKAMVKNGRRYVDNGHVVTTAGISAGVDGSLHVVARLLGRRVAEQVASYMEYHWTPESYLALGYSYLNPSTDALGREMQTAEMQFDAKSFSEAAATYRSVLKANPRNRDGWDGLAYTLDALRSHADAADAFAHAAEGAAGSTSGYRFYNAAVQYAKADRRDDAVAMLGKALAGGYPRDGIATDPALAALRADPRLKEIVTAAR